MVARAWEMESCWNAVRVSPHASTRLGWGRVSGCGDCAVSGAGRKAPQALHGRQGVGDGIVLERGEGVAPCQHPFGVGARLRLRRLRGQRGRQEGGQGDQRQGQGVATGHKFYDTAIAERSASHYAGNRLAYDPTNWNPPLPWYRCRRSAALDRGGTTATIETRRPGIHRHADPAWHEMACS